MCLCKDYSFDNNASNCLTLEELLEEFRAHQNLYESADYYCALTIYKADGSNFHNFTPDNPRTIDYLCQKLPASIYYKAEVPQRLRFVLTCVPVSDLNTPRSKENKRILVDKIVSF